MAIVENTVVKVGDAVGFKIDYERYGSVHKIEGNVLTIKMWNSNEGDYYYVKQMASDCWMNN